MATPNIRLATSLPAEFLEALGAVAVNFGALENSLSSSIWMLLGGGAAEGEERYQIVTAQMSLKNLVWTFESLYRQQFGTENESALKDLRARTFSAEQKRNTLIHSLWVEGNAGTALRLKLLARGEYKLAAEQHTKDELIEVANELAQLTYDVTKFTVSTLFPEE
jgi:hypothetical protein